MAFTFDYYNRPERPIVYLANQNKKILGTLQARNLQGDLCFNNISTISFTVYKYEDGKLTYNYEKIEETLLVNLINVGWFLINKISRNGDGVNEYLEITASSLEYEACSKLLTSFGQLGVSTDEQGGLDRYKLYDMYDTAHSIIHIWLQKMPSWTVGYIDPAITTQYRTFTDDEVGAYSFLVDKVSQTFECIFQFDTDAQTISAYKLENIGRNTSIYLSYDNVIVNTILESDESDIKTVYTVAGGDDNGSTLGIIEVNPAGTNMIANFSYYKKWMSEALRTRYEQYEVAYLNRSTSFTTAITSLQSMLGELNDLYNKLPSTPDSTWSEYGLVALQEKYDIYNNNMAVYIGRTDSTSIANYNTNFSLRESVNAELNVRKSQISAKDTQIKNQEAYCKTLTINLREFLGEELFKELSRFFREDTFTDDTFIVTESMTDAEALEMKRELLDMALKDLAKRCKPSYTLEIDAINFTQIPEFRKYTEQLALGNIMTIDFGDGILVESRLLKMHINWDNQEDFSLTFSSKNRLDGYDIQLAEAQAQSSAISTSYNLNGTGWNNAKNKTSSFSEYMSSTLDMQNQKLKNSSNETFTIDSTGTKWRKKLDNSEDYSPNQMWGVGNGLYMTQNAWQTVSLAIGEGTYNGQAVYGVWAPLLCGDLILGNQLAIMNEAGNFSITNAYGFQAVNGIYSVTINPNTPSEIFKIAVNGDKKLYVDTVNNKLVFSGDLQAASGTFSGQITGGSININNGRFSVDQYGNCLASSLSLTGGNININDRFIVDSNGIVTINSNGLIVNSSNFHLTADGTLTCNNGNFNGIINSSTFNGGNITIGNGSFVVDNNGNLFAASANFGGTTNKVTVDNNGIIVKDGITGQVLSRVYINGIETSHIYCDYINGGIPYTSAYTHYQPSTTITPVYTDAHNVGLNGVNVASVTWVDDNFQRKSSSDFRLKKNIRSLNELPDSLYFEFKPKLFEFKCSPYKQNTSSIGLLAQEIINLFTKYGLDAFQYGIVEYANVRPYTDECMYISDGKLLRVNYDQLIVWGMKISQKQENRINQQENRISELEERLSKIENCLIK